MAETDTKKRPAGRPRREFLPVELPVSDYAWLADNCPEDDHLGRYLGAIVREWRDLKQKESALEKRVEELQSERTSLQNELKGTKGALQKERQRIKRAEDKAGVKLEEIV